MGAYRRCTETHPGLGNGDHYLSDYNQWLSLITFYVLESAQSRSIYFDYLAFVKVLIVFRFKSKSKDFISNWPFSRNSKNIIFSKLVLLPRLNLEYVKCIQIRSIHHFS